MLERAPQLEESALPLANTQVLHELTGAREIDTVAQQLAAQLLQEHTGVGDFDTASLAAYIGDLEERPAGRAEPVTGRATQHSLLVALSDVIDMLRHEDSSF